MGRGTLSRRCCSAFLVTVLLLASGCITARWKPTRGYRIECAVAVKPEDIHCAPEDVARSMLTASEEEQRISGAELAGRFFGPLTRVVSKSRRRKAELAGHFFGPLTLVEGPPVGLEILALRYYRKVMQTELRIRNLSSSFLIVDPGTSSFTAAPRLRSKSLVHADLLAVRVDRLGEPRILMETEHTPPPKTHVPGGQEAWEYDSLTTMYMFAHRVEPVHLVRIWENEEATLTLAFEYKQEQYAVLRLPSISSADADCPVQWALVLKWR